MSRSLFGACVFLFCAAPALWAAVALPYGDEPGKVAFYNSNNHPEAEEPVPLGPLSFRVARGECWVADSVAGRLYRLDDQGKLLKTLPVPKEGETILLEDIALIKDPNGQVEGIWVLEGGAQHVIRLAPEGEVVKTFGGRGDQPGQFIQMHRLEVGPDGRLFIADKGRQKILIFAADGTFEREVPWQWSGLCLDAAGNLCRLWYDEAKKTTSLVIETPDGKPVKTVPLALGDHSDPELWFMNERGEACLTYVPATGFAGVFKFAVCGPDGQPRQIVDLKPPLAMNRFLDRGEGTFFLGVADYRAAPAGEFRIEAWNPR